MMAKKPTASKAAPTTRPVCAEAGGARKWVDSGAGVSVALFASLFSLAGGGEGTAVFVGAAVAVAVGTSVGVGSVVAVGIGVKVTINNSWPTDIMASSAKPFASINSLTEIP